MSGDLLDDMRTTVLDFIEQIKEEIFTKPEEIGDIVLVEFFFKRMHRERIMQHMVKHILPYKKKIKQRNVDFFLGNKNIFAGLPSDRICYYSDIIANGNRISDEDREVVWDFFDTFIALAEEYKKHD